MFEKDQKVVLQGMTNEPKLEGELGVVVGTCPAGFGIEVKLLRDHVPGEDFGRVTTISSQNMRLATSQEIHVKALGWVARHRNYKLPAGILEVSK